MKNPELYHKTVDVLVRAYFNDTLEHLNCRACAVGNLVAAGMGMKLVFIGITGDIVPAGFVPGDVTKDSGMWLDAIGRGCVSWLKMTDDIAMQVKSTGYTAEELAWIEHAFEHADLGRKTDEWMFNGLMAVIDVLDQIHENTDETTTTTTKARFNEHYLHRSTAKSCSIS